MTQADFEFTVNVTMAVSDAGTIEDAAVRIEDAIWAELPSPDYDPESIVVTGKLA